MSNALGIDKKKESTSSGIPNSQPVDSDRNRLVILSTIDTK